MNLSLIVASSDNGVIGVKGDLPWHISTDLKRFKRLTMGHHMVMGRKTFDSIGRCLPGRTTVIVTRNASFQFDGAKIVHDMHSARLAVVGDDQPFVVGGSQIYRAALPLIKTVYLTRVLTEIDGDAWFPINELDDDATWRQVDVEGPHEAKHARENILYQFETYERI